MHTIIPSDALPEGFTKDSVFDLKQAVFNGPYTDKSWDVVELVQEGFPKFCVNYGYDMDDSYDGYYQIILIFYNSDNKRVSSLNMYCDVTNRVYTRSITLSNQYSSIKYGVKEDGELFAL